MKLFEEFKLYEIMWDEEQLKGVSSKELQEDNEADPVHQILSKMEDIDFEFGGFDRERYEDKWSNTSGHYTNDWTDHYGYFNYSQDAMTVFEDIRDEIIPKYIDKVEQVPLIQECRKLYYEWNNSTDETEDETGAKFELFIAQHLEDLSYIFNDQLTEKYMEEAEAWAAEHLEPEDY